MKSKTRQWILVVVGLVVVVGILVGVKAGQSVEKDDFLVAIEAMKVQVYINSPIKATVKEVLVKAGDLSAIPVRQIPIEKGEPLALELAHFVDSIARAKQPKVGAALGKSALEVAITITEQIRAAANS